MHAQNIKICVSQSKIQDTCLRLPMSHPEIQIGICEGMAQEATLLTNYSAD